MKMAVEDFKNIKIEDYTYELPEERIAKFPLPRREASGLLVYEEGKICGRRFSDVTSMLQPGQTLVFNNTKVIHARLFFRKPTGAVIEVFCLEPYKPADYACNFSARRECWWKCMVGNLRKWKEGVISCRFGVEEGECVLEATAADQRQGEVIVHFAWNRDITFSEVLEECGKIPIPPYLNRESEASDEIRYQTVYSREEGSVAAPTAGLHFTRDILSRLGQKGVRIAELTLHVGAGTFRPVKADTIGGHEMHTEHLAVSRTLIDTLLHKSGDVVAVGTTSVRTLESLYWMGVKRLVGEEDFFILGQWEAYALPGHYSLREALEALAGWFEETHLEVLKARTTIIIVPGYRFRVVGAMFTNFHQPQSTLLLLVGAAVGDDWRRIYDYALKHDFRFLSYGDSSFLKIRSEQ